ncbi:MAG: LON peptidase substrate-binding domain-containing protein [Bacteroidota bacterium]
MTNFIPIFPLNIVVFPGEPLNLHIFEPRYKQLIKECVATGKKFGIPSIIEKTIEEYGTLMQITEVVKEYENGEIDVRTQGISVFRILQHIHEIPDKLYSGAIVSYPPNITDAGDSELSRRLLSEVKRLYTLLNLEEKFKLQVGKFVSYDIGHVVGLSKAQEYDLLGLFNELQRLEYLRRHMNKILPIVKELEQVKARIKMNGHFRDLSLGGSEI